MYTIKAAEQSHENESGIPCTGMQPLKFLFFLFRFRVYFAFDLADIILSHILPSNRSAHVLGLFARPST